MLGRQRLRAMMLEKLKSKRRGEIEEKSRKIQEKLFKLKAFKQAKTVMFYLAQAYEVQTRSMIEEALKKRKKVVVPTCDIKAKKIIPCLLEGLGAGDFKKGAYRIDEPRCRKPVAKGDIDLIVVPGLAFDTQGNRLGRGAGYYDRFLDTVPDDIPKVGLAFRYQVLKRLSHCQPHDVRLDKVLFA